MLSRLQYSTVDSVLTHSDPWTPKAMGYYRVWVSRMCGHGDSGRGKDDPDHAQFDLCMSQIHLRKYARDIWLIFA